jgi:hypothetical protein
MPINQVIFKKYSREIAGAFFIFCIKNKKRPYPHPISHLPRWKSTINQK